MEQFIGVEDCQKLKSLIVELNWESRPKTVKARYTK